MDLAAARKVAAEAVREASAITEAVRAELCKADLQTKADSSPVTVADFAAQAVLILRLRAFAPTLPVVAEESATTLRGEVGAALRARVVAAVRSAAGLGDISEEGVLAAIDAGSAEPYDGRAGSYFWCIDPVDGTKGFLRSQQYAVCLGLIEIDKSSGIGTPVLGVLGCPNLPVAALGTAARSGATGVLLHGVLGGGACVEPLASPGSCTALAVAVPPPAEARCVESVEPGSTDQARNAAIATAAGLITAPLRLDSQCKYAAIARGDVALYLRLSSGGFSTQNIWDHAAGVALVVEAGGVVTDGRGAPLDFAAGPKLSNNEGSIVASGDGGLLHGRVIRAVATTAPPLPAGPPVLDPKGLLPLGLELRRIETELDVRGAAALLELCDVECGLPGKSDWRAAAARCAAEARSYLPAASAPELSTVDCTHGPDTDQPEQRRRSAFWVLRDARGVLGTVAVHPGKGGSHQAVGPADPCCAVVACFGLSPALRGRGLGQLLYSEVEQFCVADGGFTRMWLKISRRQVAAHKLYMRNGWQVFQSIDNSYEDDLLGKELKPASSPAAATATNELFRARKRAR